MGQEGPRGGVTVCLNTVLGSEIVESNSQRSVGKSELACTNRIHHDDNNILTHVYRSGSRIRICSESPIPPKAKMTQIII